MGLEARARPQLVRMVREATHTSASRMETSPMRMGLIKSIFSMRARDATALFWAVGDWFTYFVAAAQPA